MKNRTKMGLIAAFLLLLTGSLAFAGFNMSSLRTIYVGGATQNVAQTSINITDINFDLYGDFDTMSISVENLSPAEKTFVLYVDIDDDESVIIATGEKIVNITGSNIADVEVSLSTLIAAQDINNVMVNIVEQ